MTLYFVLQSCELVTLATSSVGVDTVSLNVSNVMEVLTVWTTRMRRHVVSVTSLLIIWYKN